MRGAGIGLLGLLVTIGLVVWLFAEFEIPKHENNAPISHGLTGGTAFGSAGSSSSICSLALGSGAPFGTIQRLK